MRRVSKQPGVIAAGSVSGIASTGANAINIQAVVENLAPPPPPANAAVPMSEVDAPEGLINLPMRLTRFVGRQAQLGRLDTEFGAGGAFLVHTVHGLGGIGKSALAAHWADQHRDSHSLVWWITADSPESITSGLASLAMALQPDLGVHLSSSVLQERAVQWLSSHEGWLLILDNVDRPADILDLVNRLPRGRILITSRRTTGWPGRITTLRLDVLALDEAVTLISSLVAIDAGDAAAVCAHLGCLPLAVEQAGAYLSQTGIAACDYLRLLGEQPKRLLGAAEEGRSSEGTIAQVWRVTLDALSHDPLVGRVLRMLAWFGPEAVPRRLLSGLGDEAAVVAALGQLAAYSMITVSREAVAVHRLVQTVARTEDPDDPHRQLEGIAEGYLGALLALTAAVPESCREPTTWLQWRELLPHLDLIVAGRPSGVDEVDVSIARLLSAFGLFLQEQGDHRLALTYFEQALADCQRICGPDHPDTIGLLNNVAVAHAELGDPVSAIPLLERAFRYTRLNCGSEHAETLNAMNNLAATYEANGEVTRALEMFGEALDICRRVLDDDHPYALSLVGNFASACSSAGNFEAAAALYRKMFFASVRAHGNDHPTSIGALNNLACAHQSAGDVHKSFLLSLRAFHDCRRVFGMEHPRTILVLRNLIGAYADLAE